MIIKNRRAGFSLLELVVVIAVFGVLFVVATNFLLGTLSTNNKITIENEVRENGTLVMQDMVNELRKAACISYTQGSMTESAYLYVSNDLNALTQTKCGSDAVVFKVTPSGIITKDGQQINSGRVAFKSCSTAACSSSPSGCSPGLSISGSGVTSGQFIAAVTVDLNVQQSNASSRADSCAKIKLSQVVTPRNLGN